MQREEQQPGRGARWPTAWHAGMGEGGHAGDRDTGNLDVALERAESAGTVRPGSTGARSGGRAGIPLGSPILTDFLN